MNYYLYAGVLLLVLSPVSGMSMPLESDSYWQCKTQDKLNNEWLVKNPYQKVALNLAFEACKKESKMPKTCSASKSACEGFVQGISISPLWRCTALDSTAVPWRSNFYTQREDAALAALAYCKQKSTVSETCSINLVTCKNFNEWAGL